MQVMLNTEIHQGTCLPKLGPLFTEILYSLRIHEKSTGFNFGCYQKSLDAGMNKFFKMSGLYLENF